MTPEEFSIRMETLANALPNAVDKAMRFAVEEAQTIMMERVFNDKEKVDGSSLGQYKSEAYKKLRIKNNLKVNVRDFQFTNNLRDNIKANTSIDNYSVEFTGSRTTKPKRETTSPKTITNATIGFGLEERLYGKRRTAFYLSQNEIKLITEQVNDIYTNEVNAILGT